MACNIVNNDPISSPVGRICLPSDRLFGGTTGVNVLPYFLGTPDVVTNVNY